MFSHILEIEIANHRFQRGQKNTHCPYYLVITRLFEHCFVQNKPIAAMVDRISWICHFYSYIIIDKLYFNELPAFRQGAHIIK